MRPIWVTGTGLWTPGYASVDAWLEGSRDDSMTKPAADLAGSRIKRGTSLLTRMQVEVVGQAARAAGFDLSRVATVFASANGEIEIAIAQMDMMREGDGILSPVRFKNSVHNTGSGVCSIATENRGFTTAVAADHATVPLAFLEAWGVLATAAAEVIVVAGDEPLPPPLNEGRDYDGLGVAFALTRERPAHARAKLSNLCMPAASGGPPPREVPARLVHNPCAVALGLLAGVHGAEAATVPLGSWTVSVEPA